MVDDLLHPIVSHGTAGDVMPPTSWALSPNPQRFRLRSVAALRGFTGTTRPFALAIEYALSCLSGLISGNIASGLGQAERGSALH
jgi:hypothetical protein